MSLAKAKNQKPSELEFLNSLATELEVPQSLETVAAFI